MLNITVSRDVLDISIHILTESLSQETMLLAWILINILCYHSYLLDGQMVKRGVFDLIPNNRLGKRKKTFSFHPSLA